MRKKKQPPKIKVTCQMCSHFFHSELTKNNQVHNPRQCKAGGRETHSIDEVCENFELSNSFYCDKSNHKITLLMCHQRKVREFEGCGRCKQFKEVLAAEDLAGVYVQAELRPSVMGIQYGKNQVEIKSRLKKRAHITIMEKPE